MPSLSTHTSIHYRGHTPQSQMQCNDYAIAYIMKVNFLHVVQFPAYVTPSSKEAKLPSIQVATDIIVHVNCKFFKAVRL